ncbi:Ent-kaurene synthase [Camillea tinctor]|nr:Ent-kaurene synthase [Camillea tinctor]
MDPSFHDQADAMLTELASQCDTGQGIGSMSSSIYDTAWLSMIHKPDSSDWLFPECFDFLLTHQLASGAWVSYSTVIDGILNTAAALLSLKQHLISCPGQEEWISRSLKAERALQHLLDDWIVSSSDQVGFEILVVKHLALLKEQGVVFDFPQSHIVWALYDSKMSRLPVSNVYESRCTLHHSLEALIGHIDFDQVSSWQEADGSMMGSPSSTAAYLIYTSNWNSRAESYLRAVLKHQGPRGNGNGGVPCAWPTTIFEITWVITTLAGVRFPFREASSARICKFLEQSLATRHGTIGFSLSSLPDADDTAKTIMALRFLGKSVSIQPLLEAFEAETHFKTYHGERNASFSANCNVLICILMLEDPTRYTAQIAKAAIFLSAQIWEGNVQEKWHTHKLYWMMLLAEAFVSLCIRLGDDLLREKVLTEAPYLKDQIPPILLQILVDTLQTQSTKKGSWDNICEVTAYAVLTLSSLARLPWIYSLHQEEITTSIKKGKSFLEANRNLWKQGHYLWIEKVTYASNVLSEAYCLAAAFVSAIPSDESLAFCVPDKTTYAMGKAKQLIQRTSLFSHYNPLHLQSVELQACHFLVGLKRKRLEIFPRTAMGEDKYLTFIPLTWTSCNALEGSPVSLSDLQEMMVLSMLNYQVDEYMESIIEREFQGEFRLIRTIIQRLCTEISPIRQACANTTEEDIEPILNTGLVDGEHDALKSIEIILRKYITHILCHKKVLMSHETLQERLASELQTFLLAHVTQAENNHQFVRQCDQQSTRSRSEAITAFQINSHDSDGNKQAWLDYVNPGRTFYNWVRSTSADHTSCPFSFVFFNCLVTTSGEKGIFATATTAYVSEDLCRHLASLCRMYNDFGSVSRDAVENNLNSVNFPEFHHNSSSMRSGTAGKYENTTLSQAKDELMGIAEYERQGLDMALAKLKEGIENEKLMKALGLFISVTDLFGHIYIQKDIATRMK